MQTLVYGNWNKFISATDTTRKVQGKMQKVSCWEKFKFCTASTALNVRYKCCAHESSNMMKYLMMFLYLWIKDYLRDGQSVHKNVCYYRIQ